MPAAEVDPYDRLSSHLLIDKHNLDEAIIQQAGLYSEVSDEVALAQADYESEKGYLDQLAGELDGELRVKYPKLAVQAINAKVQAHREMSKQRELVNKRLRWFRRWQGLQKAYEQRANLLKALVSLYTSEYFMNKADSISVGAGERIATRNRRESAGHYSDLAKRVRGG